MVDGGAGPSDVGMFDAEVSSAPISPMVLSQHSPEALRQLVGEQAARGPGWRALAAEMDQEM